MKPLSKGRVRVAVVLAVIADAVQVGAFPLFVAGDLSPFNIALDIVMAVAMLLLVGWHIAFLPSFIMEQVPMLNLAPTWTIAVIIATRGRTEPGDEILPGEHPAPQQTFKAEPPNQAIR